MPTTTLPPGDNPRTTRLSPRAALRLAWLGWGILLAGPFLLLQVLVWYVPASEMSRLYAPTTFWFLAAMAYLIVVVPALFFVRGHLFRDYWMGRPVPPRNYVIATIVMGAALALGGIISLIGCMVTASFMPNLIPGFIALLLFLMHWPTGSAMTRNSGNSQDHQIYQEPH